eukprot:6383826-Prymnesium_polylepis.1
MQHAWMVTPPPVHPSASRGHRVSRTRPLQARPLHSPANGHTRAFETGDGSDERGRDNRRMHRREGVRGEYVRCVGCMGCRQQRRCGRAAACRVSEWWVGVILVNGCVTRP